MRLTTILVVVMLGLIFLPLVLGGGNVQDIKRITFAITTNTEGELNPCG
ncbi:MAG: hypothetical protein ACUVUU_07955 [bacterium]